MRQSNMSRFTSAFTPATAAFVRDLNTKFLARLSDATGTAYVPGFGYPARPSGTIVRVEWFGPTLPPEMAILDTWIEVPE